MGLLKLLGLKKHRGSDSEKLKPVYEKQRPLCPFYGFHHFNGNFMDQKGNQCAIAGGYTPCELDIHGFNPDLDQCPHRSEEGITSLKKVSDNLRVFPKEFWPDGAREFNGISFSQWYEYVMKKPL